VYANFEKNIFGGSFYVRSKFSCVRSSHNLHAHAHSLEGTLITGCFMSSCYNKGVWKGELNLRYMSISNYMSEFL